MLVPVTVPLPVPALFTVSWYVAGAEVLAVHVAGAVPPFNGSQVHVQGPVPLTIDGFPTMHRFVLGAVKTGVRVALPQNPMSAANVADAVVSGVSDVRVSELLMIVWAGIGIGDTSAILIDWA